tara:strand:- start:519 stop:716 length:198 start_codon:yes stop_codon:yes gene_type:complete
MHSYKNDPFYQSKVLTVEEIERAHRRAKKLHARAFLDFVNYISEKDSDHSENLVAERVSIIKATE